MKAFTSFIAAGTAMLAATVGTCLLLQEDAPKSPVYSGEVRGRLSVPSGRLPSASTAPAEDAEARSHALSGPEGKGGFISEAAISEKAVHPETETGSPASANMDAEGIPLKMSAPLQHAAEAGEAAVRAEAPAGKAAVPSAGALKEGAEGKGDRHSPLQAAASPQKTGEAVRAEKKSPQAKKQTQLSDRSRNIYDKSVTSASFSMSGSTIKLTLRGNAPMVGHYFTLHNPERIVLDLAGGWDVSVPPVPSNRLIRSVRTGRHEDKTRLVFDMKAEGKAVLVPVDRNSLELSVR